MAEREKETIVETDGGRGGGSAVAIILVVLAVLVVAFVVFKQGWLDGSSTKTIKANVDVHTSGGTNG